MPTVSGNHRTASWIAFDDPDAEVSRKGIAGFPLVGKTQGKKTAFHPARERRGF
jgi:hypothetical protein